MGQRSQIYVRYNKKLVVANYYQWNYGERMISRARHGIEYIKNNLLGYRNFIFNPFQTERLSRIFDTNFDMKDVQISTNIIEEWKDQFFDDNFNDVVFWWQDNNDGRLFVDILEDGTIKYAFLDYDCDVTNIMNAAQYMEWDNEDWKNSEYIDDEQKKQCEDNLKTIEEMATLMTKEEIEDFINFDYGYGNSQF